MIKFKHFLKRPDGNKHTVSKVSSLFVAVLQVWFWGTPTVWPRCVLSLATRFWGSSSRRVWPRTCPRISTTLSRRLWQSGSIWRETERYNQRVTASAPKCHQFEFQQKSALFEMWLLFQDVCRSILKSYSLKAQTWDTKKSQRTFRNDFIPITCRFCACRTRMPSSVWSSSRAESTGWPGTTRPRESWPPTGSSMCWFCFQKLFSFLGWKGFSFSCTEVVPHESNCTIHCPALLSLRVVIFLLC